MARQPDARRLTLRLLLDITAHGFGHLAQCAPVVAALREAEPLELSVRSGLPGQVLRDRLGPIAQHIPADTDFGAVMRDAFAVDDAATLARYRVRHAGLPEEVRALAATLRRLRCEAVLSNVTYVAPMAAAAAGIPCVLFSSLTWHDVLRTCCPEATDLAEEVMAGYRHATSIFRLVPGTGFHGLDSTAVTQPIARVGRRRQDLLNRIGGDTCRPMALLAVGGMLPGIPPPLVHAPGEFRLVGPAVWQEAGVIPVETLGVPFEDLLASADVVVSKPGYGIVAELGCIGTPAVLVARPGWPEEPDLSNWLQERARCHVVGQWRDVTAAALRTCLSLPAPALERAKPGGEATVAAAVRVAAWPGGAGFS